MIDRSGQRRGRRTERSQVVSMAKHGIYNTLGYIKQTLDKVQTRVYDGVTCPAHMNKNDHWTIEDKDKTKLHTKNKT